MDMLTGVLGSLVALSPSPDKQSLPIVPTATTQQQVATASPTTLAQQSSQQQQLSSPVGTTPVVHNTINLHVAPTAISHASPNVAVAPNVSITAASSSNNLNSVSNTLISNIKNISPREIQQHLSAWLAEHSGSIALAAGTSSYLALSGYLITTHYAITHSFWGNWKKHLSIKEFYELLMNDATKKELCQQLVFAILKHHLNPLEPMSGIRPLINFMQTIDQELTIINRFIMVSSIMLSTPVCYILPINKQKLLDAKRCRQRLQLFKRIFTEWLATCNMQQLINSSTTTPA